MKKKIIFTYYSITMMFSRLIILISMRRRRIWRSYYPKLIKHMTEKEVIKIMGDDFERDELWR